MNELVSKRWAKALMELALENPDISEQAKESHSARSLNHR